MGALSGNINAEAATQALGNLDCALTQLQDMSVVVELDPPASDSEALLSAALGSEGRNKKRQKSKRTDTVTVNEVPSPLEPFGHATISIDEDTAVGLIPNSDAAAFLGLVEDLDTGSPHFVPGHIQTDYRIPEDHATIHVTPQQAKEMRAFIKQAEADPQVYDVLYQNCAEWVEEVLGAAAINTPADVTPGGLVEYLKNKYPQ